MRTTVRELRELATAAFTTAGLSKTYAQQSADVLIAAEAWGLQSHGFLRLPVYLDRLASGGYNKAAKLVAQQDTGPLAVFNGQQGLGLWQMVQASEEAAMRAKKYGIAAVAVADSGHCGALGYSVDQLARQGLVGLAFSTGPATLPPWGGNKKLLSTSPIAAGFPIDGVPIVIDMALSTVARGKIAAMAKTGEPLPDGWALDAYGQATNDAKEALEGMLSPLGGAKGFALAFMVESLTAGLIGPTLAADAPDFFDKGAYDQPQGIAHLVIAIDPSLTDGSGISNRARKRLTDLTVRTKSAGGRAPGANRRSLAELSEDEVLEIDLELYRTIIERLGEN